MNFAQRLRRVRFRKPIWHWFMGYSINNKRSLMLVIKLEECQGLYASFKLLKMIVFRKRIKRVKMRSRFLKKILRRRRRTRKTIKLPRKKLRHCLKF